MYDLDIYNKKIENNNMIYSIDKIRLKTYITYEQYSALEFLINTSYKEEIEKFWISDRPMCFKYNYNLEIGEGQRFYFCFLHNSERCKFNKDNSVYNFTIEFNPNKLKDNSLILHILHKYSNWFLKSFDLAIDIPVNILDLLFDIGKKRKVNAFLNGGDDLSYCYGKNNGRIKIYNKKNESKLNIVGYLTRIEVTREFEDFPISNIKLFDFGETLFPCIYLNQYVFSFSDVTNKDKTVLALLYAVQSRFSS